jgi:hypothetical protein
MARVLTRHVLEDELVHREAPGLDLDAPVRVLRGRWKSRPCHARFSRHAASAGACLSAAMKALVVVQLGEDQRSVPFGGLDLLTCGATQQEEESP